MEGDSEFEIAHLLQDRVNARRDGVPARGLSIKLATNGKSREDQGS